LELRVGSSSTAPEWRVLVSPAAETKTVPHEVFSHPVAGTDALCWPRHRGVRYPLQGDQVTFLGGQVPIIGFRCPSLVGQVPIIGLSGSHYRGIRFPL